ncbi:MAG TPA: hypothetical protein PKB03_10235 [Baekduia sp.]|nr:hypothetical protein [Baekduia sp.]
MDDIYIDYNTEGDDGRFRVRRVRVADDLAVGDVVHTLDDDGNRLTMTVVDADDQAFSLSPDWDSWHPCSEPVTIGDGVGVRFVDSSVLARVSGFVELLGDKRAVWKDVAVLGDDAISGFAVPR